MKIGKREIIVNPDVKKFVCILAIVTGWFMWPKESEYVQYETSRNVKAQAIRDQDRGRALEEDMVEVP